MSDKSKEKLKKQVQGRVTNMFEKTLDFVEVICTSKESYRAMRSKILGLGNDCIRTIQKDLERYDVEYKTQGEEIVEIQQK